MRNAGLRNKGPGETITLSYLVSYVSMTISLEHLQPQEPLLIKGTGTFINGGPFHLKLDAG